MVSGGRSLGEGFTEHDERIEYFVKFAPRQNFGDYLPQLFCQEFLTSAKLEADVFRLIGSVIEERWIRYDLARVNGTVSGLIAFWCCGARRDAAIDPALLSHCRFFGARGPLTRDLLNLPADTVLGDPGLLLPLVHRPEPHPETTGRSICIPHLHDPMSEAGMLALSGADIVVRPEIDASAAALVDVIDRIVSADFVLTGSLHGAIVACAYKRPFAFWDNGHVDAPFKWADFAGSVGMTADFVKTVEEGERLFARVAPNLHLPKLSHIMAVCPFFIKPAILLRALAYDGLLDRRLAAEAGSAFRELESLSGSIGVLHVESNAHRHRANRLSVQLKRQLAFLLWSSRHLLPRAMRGWLRLAYIHGR